MPMCSGLCHYTVSVIQSLYKLSMNRLKLMFVKAGGQYIIHANVKWVVRSGSCYYTECSLPRIHCTCTSKMIGRSVLSNRISILALHYTYCKEWHHTHLLPCCPWALLLMLRTCSNIGQQTHDIAWYHSAYIILAGWFQHKPWWWMIPSCMQDSFTSVCQSVSR